MHHLPRRNLPTLAAATLPATLALLAPGADTEEPAVRLSGLRPAQWPALLSVQRGAAALG